MRGTLYFTWTSPRFRWIISCYWTKFSGAMHGMCLFYLFDLLFDNKIRYYIYLIGISMLSKQHLKADRWMKQLIIQVWSPHGGDYEGYYHLNVKPYSVVCLLKFRKEALLHIEGRKVSQARTQTSTMQCGRFFLTWLAIWLWYSKQCSSEYELCIDVL